MNELEQMLRRIVAEVVRDELAKRDAKPANDALLTVAEFARRNSLSESAVRKAIREHRLAVERQGRAVRISAGARIARKQQSQNDRARLRLLGRAR